MVNTLLRNGKVLIQNHLTICKPISNDLLSILTNHVSFKDFLFLVHASCYLLVWICIFLIINCSEHFFLYSYWQFVSFWIKKYYPNYFNYLIFNSIWHSWIPFILKCKQGHDFAINSTFYVSNSLLVSKEGTFKDTQWMAETILFVFSLTFTLEIKVQFIN